MSSYKITMVWTDRDVALLLKWKKSATGYRYMHKLAERYYKNLDLAVKLPAIMLNAAVCTSVWTESGNRIVVITAGVGALAAAIMSSIASFVDFHDRVLHHHATSIDASHLLADISLQLSLPVHRRMSPDGFVDKCADVYEKLLETSTTLPSFTVAKFREHVILNGYVSEEDAGGRVQPVDQLLDDIVK